MPLLIYNGFGGIGHQRPNFDGYIYIHYAAPPYSARINATYFFPFESWAPESPNVKN